MGAARKKGKWIGGKPPLGYDLDREKHRLIVNPQEAELVRTIYKTYLEVKSINITTQILNKNGYTRKRFVTSKGRVFGGHPFHKSIVQHIITQPMYIGFVRYKGELYPGEHEPIIAKELFEKVQDCLAYNRRNRRLPKNYKSYGLLSQIIRCKACCRESSKRYQR